MVPDAVGDLESKAEIARQTNKAMRTNTTRHHGGTRSGTPHELNSGTPRTGKEMKIPKGNTML